MNENLKKVLIKTGISLVVGCILGILYCQKVVEVNPTIGDFLIIVCLIFGYTFGFGCLRMIVAFFAGATAGASISSMIKGSTGGTLFILFLLFVLALAIGWIPGFFYGLYQIIRAIIVSLLQSKENEVIK